MSRFRRSRLARHSLALTFAPPLAIAIAIAVALGLAGGTAAAQTSAAAGLAGTAAAPPADPMSAAERLLFVEPHFGNIEPPATLRYTFARTGSLEPALNDEVRIELRARPGGGCCSSDGRFLSAARQVVLPPIDDAQSNPVILYFLEHDVRDMQRRTGGQPAHFRRRIRLALANGARLSDTTVRYAGRDWPARQVRISPYLDDPNRARFERYAAKEYVFVLAPGVPGGVAQLRTRLAGSGTEPLIEESVTFVEN